MESTKPKSAALIFLFSAVIFFAGCHKRVASSPAQPAATPAPTAPTVTLSASPSDITKGGSTTLTWSSTNATNLTLTPGIGTVGERGSQPVNPSQSTTYTITATGNGGRAEATASVTVTIPPARTAAASPSLDQLFQQYVKDAFFDYNKSEIRSDARQSLEKDAEFLDLHKEVRFTIEGHCDERGSEEYNLGLGDRRAQSAKKYLVGLGIPEDHIQTTSYGKERPFCTEHNEACFQQNRRGHLVLNR